MDLRRVDRALGELRGTLAEHPVDPRRWPGARWAAVGPLPGPWEGDMETQTTIRLPAPLLARLEALAVALEARPELLAGSRATRSAVLRAALVKGLEALEAAVAAGGGDGRR